MSRGATFKHLIAEIPKCDVVCNNCHTLRTFMEAGGSYHDKLSPISEKEFTVKYGDLKT